jgi:hypothetical protein
MIDFHTVYSRRGRETGGAEEISVGHWRRRVGKLELQSSHGEEIRRVQDKSIMAAYLCKWGTHLELLGKYLHRTSFYGTNV